MATHYLDVDDEITSAAARIRSARDSAIALVLPVGSRVATSRINFRLLAREAQSHHSRLSIVAPEAGTRALAASAGLPVYATVAEYEEALADGGRSATGANAETAAVLDELAATVDAPGRATSRTSVREKGGRRPDARPPDARPDKKAPAPGVRAATPRPKRHPLLAKLAFATLAIVVLAAGALGAFLFLPSATITLTPRSDALQPLQLTVQVDLAATKSDESALVAPGISQSFPVQASGTYAATGKKVNSTSASGIVTFTSTNTVQSVVIPAGTQVWTDGGTVFVTRSAVSVPAADWATSTPGIATASVTAQNAGPAGNVAAHAITRLPGSIQAAKVTVSNATATSGGSQTTTHLITQSDLDAATADLTAQLNEEFNSKLTDSGQAPDLRLFPDTRQLGKPTFDPEPATLANQPVSDQSKPTFELSVTASGTATAADMTVVRSLAETRLVRSIPAGRILVPGSIDVRLGEGVASGSAVSVPVTAAARTIPKLDAETLKSAIKGRSADAVRRYLGQFGDVSLSLSPDWLPNLPSYEFRIDLRIQDAPAPSPTPSASPAYSPSPTIAPTPSGAPAS